MSHILTVLLFLIASTSIAQSLKVFDNGKHLYGLEDSLGQKTITATYSKLGCVFLAVSDEEVRQYWYFEDGIEKGLLNSQGKIACELPSDCHFQFRNYPQEDRTTNYAASVYRSRPRPLGKRTPYQSGKFNFLNEEPHFIFYKNKPVEVQLERAREYYNQTSSDLFFGKFFLQRQGKNSTLYNWKLQEIITVEDKDILDVTNWGSIIFSYKNSWECGLMKLSGEVIADPFGSIRLLESKESGYYIWQRKGKEFKVLDWEGKLIHQGSVHEDNFVTDIDIFWVPPPSKTALGTMGK